MPPKLMTPCFKRLRLSFFLFSVLALFSFHGAFSQAVPINNPASPRHVTLDQQVVTPLFTLTLAGTTTVAQWTVLINGSSAGITVTGLSTISETAGFAASISPNNIFVAVKFDASGIPGHPAYLLPGEVLTVQFNNTGNTLTTSGSGLAVASFGPLTSKNFYSPTATGAGDIQYQSQGIASSLDQCSPVNTNFYRWTYVYSLRFRNSSKWTTNNNELNVSWGAGTGGATTNLQGYLSNSGGDPSTTTAPVDIFSALNYPGVYVSFRTGLNIASANTGVINLDGTNAYSYPNNTGVCNFYSTEYPFGVTTAVYSASGVSSLTTNKQFDSYDYDNVLPGTLGMTPVTPPANGTTTTNLVCLGTNVGAVLSDNSLFNCIGNGTILSAPAANPNTTPVNNAQRWVRIVYGGVSAATTIPDIHVNGVQVTSNAPVSTLNAAYVGNPNLGTVGVTGSYQLVTDNTPNASPLTNGYVVPGAAAFPASTPGTTDIYGVTALNVAANATTSGILSQIISTLDPSNQAIGQQFNITIQYWNVCNPYPTSTPVEYTTVSNGSLVSSGTNNAIRIVGKPAPLTATGLSVCYNAANPATNFTVGGVTGGATVKFYKDKATALAQGATLQSGASANLSTNKYTVANGCIGAPYNTNNTNGKYYSVWATQLVNTCESDPIEVVIYQQPRIDNLAADIRDIPTPNPAPDVCNNTSVLYTEAEAVPIKTIAANTATNAVAINLNTENVWSSTFASGVTITPSGSPNGTASYAFAISPQPATFISGNVGVALQYKTPDAPNVTVSTNIAGPPATVYTYTINPQTCTNTATTLPQKVYGTSAGGDISPATQTVCSGSAPASITVAGTVPLPMRGAVVGWQKRVNGVGGFTADGTLGIANPLILTAAQVPLVAGVQTTYEYQAVVQNGPCTSALSPIATVIVNPVPAQPTITPSGPTTFCLGSSVTLSSSNGNAAAYQWYLNGTVIVGATAQTYLINTIAQSGSYTVQTIGVAPSNCVSTISTPTVVTVNPLPAVTGLSGGGAVCSGNPAPDIVWTLTGSSPYTGTWTDGTTTFPFTAAGVTQTATSLTVSTPNTLVAGTYQLLTLQDANGCSATALGGTATITIGGTPPTFVAPVPSLSPVAACDNGASTTDPQLDFALDALSASKINFILTYTIDASANRTKTFNTNASSQPTAAITFTDAELNAVGAHTLTLVSIQSAAGCLSIFNTPLTFTVNPLPPAPSGATGAVSCVSNATGSQLSVNDPGAGFTILWSTTAAPVYTAVGGLGTIAGIRNQLFTPNSTATTTYFAFAQNTSTLCVSNASTAVTNTRDALPAAAAITAPSPSPIALCAPVGGNGAATPLTATAINGVDKGTWSVVSGGIGGTAITSPNNISTAITGLPGDTPAGGTTKSVVIKWNVQSQYGQLGTPNACPDNFANATININPEPTTLNPTVTFCEDVFGGGSHMGVDLTTYNASCTNGTAVAWFNDVNWLSPVGSPTSVTVSNGTKFYFKTTSALGCSNDPILSAGVLTFVVNTLPTVVNQNLSFCEDHAGVTPIPPNSNQHGPFDLTFYDVTIANGSLVNRSVSWFTDAGATLPVPSPATYTLVGNQTLYAKVTNTLTNCANTATVNLTTLPRPIDNPVVGNASVCTGNNILLYQLDPTFNSTSTYTWSVVGTPPAAVTLFGGGGTNSANFFALLKFPAATGTVDIDVFETLNGCNGNTSHLTVNVNSAPVPNTIIGLTQVCTGQTSVTYSVTPFAGNPSSNYSWLVGAGASNTGPLTVNSSAINVDFGTISPVSIQVTETSSTGCVGTPASIPVTVNPRPLMTSPAVLTICSGDTPPNNFFTSSIASNYNWTVASITGVTGTTVGQSGSGDLASTFAGASALRNTSGVIGSVTFNVTPTTIAAPGCQGTTQPLVVSVNPEPVLVVPQKKTICSGAQVNYEIVTTPSNLPANNTFTWPAPAMSDLSTQGSSGTNVPAGLPGTIHITDILTNTSTSSITATYSITPTSGAGCTGTPRDVAITVNPQPVMTSTNSNTICSGTAPTLVFTSSVASTYAWTVTNITGTLTGVTNGQTGTGNFSATFTGAAVIKNTSLAPATVTFNVIPTSSTGSGCVGSPQIVTLTIEPEPLMTSAPTVTICSGAAPILTFTSSIAATYSWTVTSILGTVTGVTNGQTGAGDLSNTFSGAGAIKNVSGSVATISFNVVPLATSGLLCAGAPPQTVTLTVNPEPVMTSVNNTTICSRGTPSLVFSANVASTFAWTVSAITGAPTGVTIGQTGNGDLSSTFTGASSISNTSGVLATVTFNVIPTASTGTGCSGAPQPVTLKINPEPKMTSSNADAICSGGTPALIFTSDVASSYNWKVTNILGTLSGVVVGQTGTGDLSATFAGGTAIRNTTVSSGKVTFDVTPTSTTGTGCVGTPQTVTLTVNPEPVMTSPTNPLPYCSGDAPSLTFTSSVPSAYNWIVTGITGTLSNVTLSQSGSGNLSATFAGPAAITNTSGSLGSVTFSVIPTSTSGSCVGAAQSVTISINPEPVMTSSPTAAICSGQTPTLTFTSSIAATYTWQVSAITGTVTGVSVLQTGSGDLSSTFAGGSAIKNTSTGSASVQFLVTPTSATGSGCVGAPQPVTLTVNPEPVMTSITTPSVCSGESPTGFVFTSSISATYNWSVTNITGTLSGVSLLQSGTGDLSSTFIIGSAIRNISGADGIVTFNVVPTSGGCAGATQVVQLTVNPEPTGTDFSQPGCVNATPLNYNIQGQVSNVASVFTYTVSSDNVGVPAGANRAVASNALITDSYNNTTGTVATITYLITPFSAAHNCAGSPFKYIVTVSPVPVGSGTPAPGDLCSRSPANLTTQSFITNGVTSTFTWTATYDAGLTGGVGSGNGNISDVLTNITGGVLQAKYLVQPSASGCMGAPFTIIQKINPEPVMTSTLAMPFLICSTNSVSSNPTAVTLSVSNAVAASYDIVLKSQDAGITGTPTTGNGLSAAAIAGDKFGNTTSAQLKVVYTVTPMATTGSCQGAPIDITVQINPEPVLFSAGVPQVCSTNSSNPANPINVVLTTNGTSAPVGSSGYKLIAAVQYSTGGPFSNTLPTGFTIVSATPSGSTGDLNLIKLDTYKNTSNVSVTVRYSIQATSASGGCLSVPLNYDVIINPEPILSPGLVTTCSGAAPGAAITLAADPLSTGISQYNLKQVLIQSGLTPNGSNAGLGIYNNGTFLTSDVFTNTTGGQLQATYNIAPISTAGCVGADQNVVLKVNPAPAVSASLNTIVCSGSASGITLATTASSAPARASLGYFITAITQSVAAPQLQPDGANVGVNTTTGVNTNYINADKFTNNTNVTQTVTYSVQAITAALCTGPIQNVVLTVEPTIVATPAPLISSICSNGITSIALGSPSVPSAGPISFNYLASSSIGGQLSGFIPSVSNLPTGAVIADNLPNISNSSADVTYSVTPVANGARGGSGCSGSPVPVIVHVDPIPKLTATPLIQTICEGVAANIVLTTATSPSAGGIIKFNVVSIIADPGLSSTTAPGPYTNGQAIADVWSNANTSMSTSVYTLQPVVVGGLGCVGNPVTITLNVNPAPNVTPTIINPTLVPAAICSEDLVNISLAADVSSTVNSWTASVVSGTAKGFSNGAGDLIFQTLKNTGVVQATVRYHVTPKASGCSGPSIDVDIKVDPIPDVLFTAPAPVCYGSTLNVPLSSSVANTNFNWTVDPNNSGVPTAPASGGAINYVVKDTLTSAEDFLTFTITAVGPGATACASSPKNMSVLASPKMDGIFQNDSTWLCTGGKDFLQISLQGQAPFTLQYSDGTTTFTSTKVGNFKSVQVQPTTSITYTLVSLKDNLGCTVPLTSKVVYTVNQTDASYSILSPLEACTPNGTVFQYDQKTGTQYDWQWGDGNDSTYVATTNVAGKIIKHTFINSSLTSTLKPSIVLTTSLDSHFPNGCAKSSTKAISIFAQLKTSVAIDKSVICSGDVVKLSNQTVGVPSNGHKWFYRDLGNGTQQLEVRTTNITNYTLAIDSTKSNPHVYEIVYQSTNAHCPADTTIQVTVYKSIKARFTDVVPYFVGGNATATFNNTSRPKTDWPEFRFDWNFGLDATPATLTSSSTPINVNYSSAGPRDVTLLATNVAAEAAGLTCASSITQTVSVLLAPLIAEFQVDPKRGCFPVKVTVTENLSTGDLYKWSVIDIVSRDTVASSNAAFPVFSISNDGLYIVRLLTSSSFTGQTASDTAHITLYPKPEAIFDAFPTTVYVPDQEVTTINGSGNTANQYLWDFGDGGTSTDYQPTYKYKFEGVDSLKFTAQYDHGGGVICSSTNYKMITAKQGGVAKIPNAFTPSTAGPSGGVGGVDLYNYVFLPQVKGVEEFNMQIFDRWGNLIFESNNQSIGWDGYDQHGRLMPSGVYVYKLTLRLSDQQRTTQVGDVTLIR